MNNRQFDHPKLAAILDWMTGRFTRCIVLVGDSIHRITLECDGDLSAAAAAEESLRLGRTFLVESKSIFDSYSPKIDFLPIMCSEIQTWDSYGVYWSQIRAVFLSDASFRASVESFGRQYHRKHSSRLLPAAVEMNICRSADYFIEELAIFSCLRQRHGVSVMVYPGTFTILAEIADGKHPLVPEPLKEMTVISLNIKRR